MDENQGHHPGGIVTLPFLTVLFAAGVAAWLIDLDRQDTPLVYAGTIVAGLGTGMFLGAWT